MKITRVRYYLDYFLPREVVGPVLIIFSLENVIDILFETYMPPEAGLVGWVVIALFAGLLVKEWGEADEDIEELQDELEELDEKSDSATV